VIKNGGHQPSVEMPKEYNKIVLDWLLAEPKVITQTAGKPVVEAENYSRNPGKDGMAAGPGQAIAAERLEERQDGLAQHMEESLERNSRAPASEVELARQSGL
jgi:hypothetical protein